MTSGEIRDDPRAATLRTELEVSGLSPLLAEEDVTDVMVNQRGHVFAAKVGRGSYDSGLVIDSDRIESLVATIAGLQGLVVTRDQPILEGTLPFGGVRVEGILPPVSLAPIMALRKPATRHYSLEGLDRLGTFTPPARESPRDISGSQVAPLPDHPMELLRHFVRHRWTCLIAGGVGSGKTTLLSALLGEVLAVQPTERILVCEDGAREVRSDGLNTINLLTSEQASVDMTRLLRAALRLNPDRLIVGEARGPEAFVFLKACNTGHPGGLMTIHANSALDAVNRLDDLAQEAGVGSQRARIAAALDALIFVAKAPEGRRVTEILRLDGLAPNGELHVEVLYPRPLLASAVQRQ